MIPNSAKSIGDGAFYYCTGLISVTIGSSVTSIGDAALDSCTNLTGVFFSGNAPSLGGSWVFFNDNRLTVYYLLGTTGWSDTFGDRPTAHWYLPYPMILNNSSSFGVRTDHFGFTISWATNIAVVVEACTNLASHDWRPLQTNALTSGTNYFSDSAWTNYPSRYYRIRSP